MPRSRSRLWSHSASPRSRRSISSESSRPKEKDAAAKRRQTREDILAINVEIAQTTGNAAAQKRALQAEIKFFETMIREFPRGSLARKQYILKLRQAQKDYEDIKKQTEKTKNSFDAMAFEFLTTQQGFAANLLGNLLPMGALGGTVGGTATQSPAPVVAPGAVGGGTSLGAVTGAVVGANVQGIHLPHGAAVATGPQGPIASPDHHIANAAAIAAARERGATQSQASRMIALLGAIAGELALLNRRTKHPEAKHHQVVNSRGMDGGPGGHI